MSRRLVPPGHAVAAQARKVAVDMRSLSRDARFAKRVEVIALRSAGHSYVQIAFQLGLSRTGVFDICKRHAANGSEALRDAPAGRPRAERRTLAPLQELLLRQQIIDRTPDQLGMPELLWNRAAVLRLVEQRVGIVLPMRTLALYLTRWGFVGRRPTLGPAGPAFLLSNRWLTDRYPVVLARSRVQGGEIIWGGSSRLLVESARRPHGAVGARAAPGRARHGPRELSMMSALTSKGQLRWSTFDAPLDDRTLLAFIQRLIHGARKKVFLIIDDVRVQDDSPIRTWLAEHEDEIEAFHRPSHGAGGA